MSKLMNVNSSDLDYLYNSIATIPNYPKEGILFRDVTSLLEDAKAFKLTIDILAAQFKSAGFDKIVGTEARGFIFGAPLAIALNAGFVPVRKPNKLPRAIYKQTYQLEYGEDTLEIHQDAIKPGERVLIVDDLLATGGTVLATKTLIELCGGKVDQAAFVIDLPELGGGEKIKQAGLDYVSVLAFSGH